MTEEMTVADDHKSRQARGAFRKAGPGEHDEHEPPVIAAMRAELAEWFVIEEGAPRWALGHGQNYGWLMKHPAGFEVDIRDGLPGDPPLAVKIAAVMGIVTVYARYVGEVGK